MQTFTAASVNWSDGDRSSPMPVRRGNRGLECVRRKEWWNDRRKERKSEEKKKKRGEVEGFHANGMEWNGLQDK